MKNNIFIFMTLLLTSTLAQASFVSYEAMDAFHKSRVQSLSTEYNLEGRAKITYSLLPSSGLKKSKQAIVKLPGLMLDAISLNSIKKEVGLIEIMDALKEYKRKVVILKSSKISDAEVKVLKQAIQDELFLADTKSVNVKPWSLNQIWYNDLKSSFKNRVLTSPYTYLGLIAFCIIAFLLFGLSSAILNGFKSVGKSIYDSVEQSMGNQAPAGAGGADLSTEVEDGSGVSQFEVVDESYAGGGDEQEADCYNLLMLIGKAASLKPHEFKMKMWDFFPSVEDQLSFYIVFETELQSESMEIFSQVFNSVFNLGASDKQKKFGAKSRPIQSALWQLRVALTYLVVMPVDAKRERILGSISQNYQGQMSSILDGSIKNHFKVLSFLFPEKVTDRISKLEDIDHDFSTQLLSFVSASREEKLPSDLDVRKFEDHLKENNYFADDESSDTKAKDFDLLRRLPDHILRSSESFDREMLHEFMSHVPNLSWVEAGDSKSHKSFILALTPDEATHFLTHFEKIEDFKEQLNSRTVSRLQELQIKSEHPDSVKSILGLRKKIGMFYKPKTEKIGDDFEQAA